MEQSIYNINEVNKQALIRLKMNKKCSELCPLVCKSLCNQNVKIREIITGFIFDAKVVDYGFEKGKIGIIVSFSPNITPKLQNQSLVYSDDDGNDGLDLTDMFYGHLFEIVTH